MQSLYFSVPFQTSSNLVPGSSGTCGVVQCFWVHNVCCLCAKSVSCCETEHTLERDRQTSFTLIQQFSQAVFKHLIAFVPYPSCHTLGLGNSLCLLLLANKSFCSVSSISLMLLFSRVLTYSYPLTSCCHDCHQDAAHFQTLDLLILLVSFC